MPDKPPLLLLHGYPFDHTMWEHVRAHLPKDQPVLAPDLPGFGREPVLAEEPSIDAMADFVDQWLRRQNADKLLVAGFSMGGYVALSLLERYSQRVARVALINSQPFADTDEVRAGRRTMIGRVQSEGPEAASKAALMKLFAPGRSTDPALSGYAQRGAQAAGTAGITWALEAMARRPDRTTVLRNAAKPLILHSALDQFIAVERIRQFARSHPEAAYIEVSGAGHCTPLEKPEAVAGALTTFLSPP